MFREGFVEIEEIGIIDSNLYPRCRFPVFLRVRQQVPGVLIRNDSIAVFTVFSEGIADFAKAADAGVQVRVKFGVGHGAL